VTTESFLSADLFVPVRVPLVAGLVDEAAPAGMVDE
jgi:hypothetical protein